MPQNQMNRFAGRAGTSRHNAMTCEVELMNALRRVQFAAQVVRAAHGADCRCGFCPHVTATAYLAENQYANLEGCVDAPLWPVPWAATVA